MFRYLILLFALIILKNSYGQFWAYNAGGTNVDEANSVTTDNNGNVYTTGYFGVSAQFSSTISFISEGASDIFITKHNSSGELIWAKSAGGWGEDRGFSIKSDDTGNVYVTGFFYGTATFGSQTINSSGAQDVFLAKYDTNGNLLWVVKAGGVYADIANGVAVDNNGEITITGQFKESATFDSNTINSLIDPSTGNYCINTFIAHYDNTGNFLWVKSGVCNKDSRGINLSNDNIGNLYIIGQFSDTITFDNIHNNTLNNAIFIVKYDVAGNEIWFRKIGGSLNNIAYGITTDLNQNILITGEASGTVTFFNNTNYFLTNPYNYQAFVAKYNNNGNLIWAISDGSSSEVSSKAICNDVNGDIYITGIFKCKFSEYADVFGQGTFNSVGYNDIFVTKYNNSGQRLWMRNFGSNKEDYVSGIILNNSTPLVVGSFKNCLNIPLSDSIIINGEIEFVSDSSFVYCSDLTYNSYLNLNSEGNSDIFIANAIDLSRQPYDYYDRSGNVCDRPFVGSCITVNDACPDSYTACGNVNIAANAHSSETSINTCSLGPICKYNWSNNTHLPLINVTTTGTYFVTVTTEDGCFSSNDSINIIINPIPPIPLLSDNLGFGTNSSSPYSINLCYDTTIVLSATNFFVNNFHWVCENIIPPIDIHDSVITINQDGEYYFIVTDANGCENSNHINIHMGNSSLPPIIPYFYPPAVDTITICDNNKLILNLYDSISDPLHTIQCNTVLNGIPFINITPNANNGYLCGGAMFFYPDSSGLYSIEYELIREGLCGDTDTTYAYTSVYVNLLVSPPPISLSITGGPSYCIGDTVLLTACCAPNYLWSTSNGHIIGNVHNDSVYVSQPGYYCVNSADTAITGCVETASSCIGMSYWTSPQIQMSPLNGLICPNGIVTLTLPSTGINYEWYGPNGIITSNSFSIDVNTAGYYFCIVTFPGDCRISSNTIEVRQYTTPFLVATPDDILCPNEIVQINLITNPGSYSYWLPPLSGNSIYQLVDSAGTYMCNVYSCGIQTLASVTIIASYPVSQINLVGNSVLCPGDTSTINANLGMSIYNWHPTNDTTNVITVDTTGMYYLITTDANGCTATSDTIIILSVIVPTIDVENDTICYGQALSIYASGANNYYWLNNTNSTNPIYIGNPLNLVSLLNDTTFWVYTQENNCKSIPIPVSIIVLDSLSSLTPQLFSNSPVCEGLTLNITSNVPSNYIFHWVGPNGYASSLSEINLPSNPNQSGAYTLFVENGGCLSYSSSINVTIYPTPAINISQNAFICLGDTTELTVSGGNSVYWLPSESLSQPVSYTTLAYPSQTTNYTASILDTNSCTNFANVNVYVQQPTVLTYQSNYDIIIGESVSLNIGTNQNVISWQWTPANGLSCDDCQNPISMPLETTEYNVIITDSMGCFDIQGTILIEVRKEYTVDVPSAFTPDGDGNNDVVYVRGWGIKKLLEFRIFNRWGEEVFYSNDLNYGWDGYFRNKIQNIETYVFVVRVLFYNDVEKSINGYINLIR